MKKRENIQFNFNSRFVYTFILIVFLVLGGIGVFAFGTSSPSTFGHSAGEIEDLPADKITSGIFNIARIPNLDTGKITSGILPLARGGTGTTSSTGSGSLVLSASPTLTGTLTANRINLIGDWVRVYGTRGIYFQNYGGGWFMQDTSWIRAYANKNIFTGGEIRGGTIKGTSQVCIGNDCRSSWPSSSAGDITAVTAGAGLTGGGTSGSVTLSADTTYLQKRVTQSCPAGTSIRVISASGAVTCEVDDVGSGVTNCQWINAPSTSSISCPTNKPLLTGIKQIYDNSCSCIWVKQIRCCTIS